jgi:hypothetical protein
MGNAPAPWLTSNPRAEASGGGASGEAGASGTGGAPSGGGPSAATGSAGQAGSSTSASHWCSTGRTSHCPCTAALGSSASAPGPGRNSALRPQRVELTGSEAHGQAGARTTPAANATRNATRSTEPATALGNASACCLPRCSPLPAPSKSFLAFCQVVNGPISRQHYQLTVPTTNRRPHRSVAVSR